MDSLRDFPRLHQKIGYWLQKPKWYQKFLPQSDQDVVIRISAPEYYFLRARTFLDDLVLWASIDRNLSIRWLIFLLYEDFLSAVRYGIRTKDGVSPFRVAEFIDNMKQHIQSIYYSDFVQVSDSKLVRREVLQSGSKILHMELNFKRRSVERGEMFLYDCRRYDPCFSLSFEKLICFLFISFIEKIRHGDILEIVEELVCRLD